jgi:hypothetical protein
MATRDRMQWLMNIANKVQQEGPCEVYDAAKLRFSVLQKWGMQSQ